MSPLGRYLIYCDHGVQAGHDYCWQCWKRRAMDAEEALTACAQALRDELCSCYEEEGTHGAVYPCPRCRALEHDTVRTLLGEGGGGAT